jgi:hypothetical protein
MGHAVSLTTQTHDITTTHTPTRAPLRHARAPERAHTHSPMTTTEDT